MTVLINEFEIVPSSEGEASASSNEAAPKPAPKETEQMEARDVYVLIERCEERRLRVWTH